MQHVPCAAVQGGASTQQGTAGDGQIGEDEAKRIALSHVSGAAEANIRSAHLDYDDGRAEYEIEIIYGTTEYDFEIDAVSGAVISQDMDSIYD